MIAQNSPANRRWTHIAFAIVACNMLFGLLTSHDRFAPLPGAADKPAGAVVLARPIVSQQADRITTASLPLHR